MDTPLGTLASLTPADTGRLHVLKQLERKLEEAEVGQGFNDWDALLETLGLSQ